MAKGLKPGFVLDEFTLGSRDFVVRTPKAGDAEGCRRHVNRLVKEKAFILMQKRVSAEDERKWLAGTIRGNAAGRSVTVVVETGGEIIGVAAASVGGMKAIAHVADFGIGISRHRDVGLGTRLMKLMLRLARRRLRAKLARLTVYAANERAIRCYEKVGFSECGRVPRAYNHHGRYIDMMIMARRL